MQALGWVLIVIGVAFILVGFTGAVRNMFRREQTRSVLGLDVGFLKAMTELVKALSAAPLWIACTIVGLILVVLGSRFAFPVT